MTATVPDWLKLHDGTLKAGLGGHTLFVVLAGQPQYRLDVSPAAGGQFACTVTQTVNGKRNDGTAKFASNDAALNGGLESLRLQLGW